MISVVFDDDVVVFVDAVVVVLGVVEVVVVVVVVVDYVDEGAPARNRIFFLSRCE